MSDPSEPRHPHEQQAPGHPEEQPTQPYATQAPQQGWGQPPAQGWGQPQQQGWGQPQQQGWGQPPQPWPYPVQYRQTNGLAIASLVVGVMWIYWLGSILALVFGYVARRQIRARNQSGDGMAVAGIVLGWIGVATLLLMFVVFAISSAYSSGPVGY